MSCHLLLSRFHCLRHLSAYEKRSYWNIAATERLANCLQIRSGVYVRMLPGMMSSTPAKSAHDFIHDQECTVFLANLFYGFEVTWRSDRATETLEIGQSVHRAQRNE